MILTIYPIHLSSKLHTMSQLIAIAYIFLNYSLFFSILSTTSFLFLHYHYSGFILYYIYIYMLYLCYLNVSYFLAVYQLYIIPVLNIYQHYRNCMLALYQLYISYISAYFNYKLAICYPELIFL